MLEKKTSNFYTFKCVEDLLSSLPFNDFNPQEIYSFGKESSKIADAIFNIVDSQPTMSKDSSIFLIIDDLCEIDDYSYFKSAVSIKHEFDYVYHKLPNNRRFIENELDLPLEYDPLNVAPSNEMSLEFLHEISSCQDKDYFVLLDAYFKNNFPTIFPSGFINLDSNSRKSKCHLVMNSIITDQKFDKLLVFQLCSLYSSLITVDESRKCFLEIEKLLEKYVKMLLLYNCQEADIFSFTDSRSGYINDLLNSLLQECDSLSSQDEVFLAVAVTLGLIPITNLIDSRFWQNLKILLDSKPKNNSYLPQNKSTGDFIEFLIICRKLKGDLTCYNRQVILNPEPTYVPVLEQMLSDMINARIDPNSASPALKGLKKHSKTNLPSVLSEGVKKLFSSISIGSQMKGQTHEANLFHSGDRLVLLVNGCLSWSMIRDLQILIQRLNARSSATSGFVNNIFGSTGVTSPIIFICKGLISTPGAIEDTINRLQAAQESSFLS